MYFVPPLDNGNHRPRSSEVFIQALVKRVFMPLNRDDRERIAKALMAYKADLKIDEMIGLLDGYDYVEAELGEVDALAERLELDPEYYQKEK